MLCAFSVPYSVQTKSALCKAGRFLGPAEIVGGWGSFPSSIEILATLHSTAKQGNPEGWQKKKQGAGTSAEKLFHLL